MHKPDIVVIFEESLTTDIFKSFEESVSTEGLNLIVDSREPSGPMACAEWYILTGVAAYISKSYFDGFLKEMGKDHYQYFKDHLSNLTSKVMADPRIEPTLLGTEGKISSNNPFSLAFSVHAEADDGNTFKLLIPKASNGNDYNLMVSKFMDFISDYHLGLQTLDSIGCAWAGSKPPGGMIFVHYNTDSNCIQWLNDRDYR